MKMVSQFDNSCFRAEARKRCVGQLVALLPPWGAAVSEFVPNNCKIGVIPAELAYL